MNNSLQLQGGMRTESSSRWRRASEAVHDIHEILDSPFIDGKSSEHGNGASDGRPRGAAAEVWDARAKRGGVR